MNTYFLSLLDQPRKREGIERWKRKNIIIKFGRMILIVSKFSLGFDEEINYFHVHNLISSRALSTPDWDTVVSYLTKKSFKKMNLMVRTNINDFLNLITLV
jgi:hypothetical protein